tara:strand:+ start:249 stop:476 length:228 start_codon:yes stop_codon:yes gene_type:complete
MKRSKLLPLVPANQKGYTYKLTLFDRLATMKVITEKTINVYSKAELRREKKHFLNENKINQFNWVAEKLICEFKR